jgi:hypothetical protein
MVRLVTLNSLRSSSRPRTINLRWTQYQKDLVRHLRLQGLSYEAIADEINAQFSPYAEGSSHVCIPKRTPRAVLYQCIRLGLARESDLAKWDSDQQKRNASDRSKGRSRVRAEVIRRDNKTCVVCKGSSELDIAHIIPFQDSRVNLAIELVVLCQDHHRHFDDGCIRCTNKVFDHMCALYKDFSKCYELKPYGTDTAFLRVHRVPAKGTQHD